MNALPGWAQTVVVLHAVALIVLAGRFVVRPTFRFNAQTRLREMFTAAALLLVIAIAVLMTQVGLSSAHGTFLAGVVLANSEYRHELASDIEPLQGLLLGLFFLSVGASINFALIVQTPLLIAALVWRLMCVKSLVLNALGRFFKVGTDQNLTFAVAFAQGGICLCAVFLRAATEYSGGARCRHPGRRGGPAYGAHTAGDHV